MHSLPAPLRVVTHRAMYVLTIGVATFALTSCGGRSDNPAATSSSPASTAAVTTESAPTQTEAATESTATQTGPARSVKVYFADADALQLVEETRTTTATGSDLRAAMVALAQGPQGSNLTNALPPGTEIVGTDIRGGDAYINLNSAFVAGYPPGGAAAEFAVIAPMVFTATAIDGVERVHVTVDGQTPAPTGSQYDWARGFSREDFPDVTGGAP
jgi:spore germination protein GerM